MHRHLAPNGARQPKLPAWLPEAARHYLIHTEAGLSIRAVARLAGKNPSTVSRQVRRFEARRDDPLVDEGLRCLGRSHFQSAPNAAPEARKDGPMKHARFDAPEVDGPPSEEMIAREGRRILRRLSETGAVLAVARDMDKAVVVRDSEGGGATKTAVVDRAVAQAMALKEWIACPSPELRIARYRITSVGRAALKRLLAEAESRAAHLHDGRSGFADQHRSWGERDVMEDDADGDPRARRMKYNLAESPLASLARRKDKSGAPFLSDDLVTAGERLREDFELAQMGPRVAQNWDRFLTGGGERSFTSTDGLGGPEAARARVQDALSDLGPGLGDVALRCCCFLEGLETAEKRMGWSARSGKIVLRIALTRLEAHYEARHGKGGPLIG
ncbi:MAG: DUF6456 domain-containing protein [Pseudomonadota bacterium]